MVSVNAIGSEVFGSCVEEINVSVEIENRGALLCCGRKYLSCLGRKSDSKLATEGDDGARYWGSFWAV